MVHPHAWDVCVWHYAPTLRCPIAPTYLALERVDLHQRCYEELQTHNITCSSPVPPQMWRSPGRKWVQRLIRVDQCSAGHTGEHCSTMRAIAGSAVVEANGQVCLAEPVEPVKKEVWVDVKRVCRQLALGESVRRASMRRNERLVSADVPSHSTQPLTM